MPASNHSRSSSDAEDDVDDQDNREVEVRIPHARWSLADQISPNSAALLAYGLPPMHDCISPASLMPPEILIHILRLISSPHDLYSALLVSRTWAECTVELLWHKPSLVKPSSLVKLLQTLSRDPDRVTFAYPSFIRRLNLVNHAHELTDASFTRIAVCSRLERLTLVGCEQLTDDSLCRVFGSVPNLVALDLTGVSNVSDLAILILAGVAKKLQGINLGGCKQISNESIIALSENCPLLRRIKLSGLERLTDPAVTALAKGCPLLLEVDLNDCKAISGRCVRDLWRFPRCMREMRLSGCADVGEEGFPAPPLPGAPDAYGVYPFSNPPASAQWGYSSEEDPTEPNAPLPALRLQHSYDTLRMLDLTSCIALTDTAVEGIIAAAPRIRNLVLAKCGEITDKGVEAICKLGRSLHYLHLGHANLITDLGVRHLALSCTRLRYIDLACCTLLSDMAVFELAGLPKLRRVGLVRVATLTDQGVIALASRYNTLERIHLSYCENITVMAVYHLLAKLTRLTHLSLTGIPAFRDKELQRFCRPAPKEFTLQQRSAFCVYSGSGINSLRKYLEIRMGQLRGGPLGDMSDTQSDIDGAPYFDQEIDAVAGTRRRVIGVAITHPNQLIDVTNGAEAIPTHNPNAQLRAHLLDYQQQQQQHHRGQLPVVQLQDDDAIVYRMPRGTDVESDTSVTPGRMTPTNGAGPSGLGTRGRDRLTRTLRDAGALLFGRAASAGPSRGGPA